jgi:hypothetical protein
MLQNIADPRNGVPSLTTPAANRPDWPVKILPNSWRAGRVADALVSAIGTKCRMASKRPDYQDGNGAENSEAIPPLDRKQRKRRIFERSQFNSISPNEKRRKSAAEQRGIVFSAVLGLPDHRVHCAGSAEGRVGEC